MTVDHPAGRDSGERRNAADPETIAGWPRASVTCDEFLGGRVRAYQPAKGFRAGLDSVLLAAGVSVKPGETVFDLGQGAGIASLCLLSRAGDIRIEGLEIDAPLRALAEANARLNGFAQRMRCWHGDACRPPSELARNSFDHVMTNPPFLVEGNATTGPNPGKAGAIALDEDGEAAWFKSALALLKPKGWLTVIHRADALGRIQGYLARGTGDVEVIPIYPSAGKPAIRVLVRARKGARGPMRISPGLVVHEPSGAFTAPVEAILRENAPLITSTG
jgi:tRNA1(Val) A37 N6-methylase TrmN6